MAAIPPNLEPAILEKVATGASTRDVSQWLLETHKVTASYKAVQRLLAKTKVERSAITKSVIRDKLSRTVVSDIDRLGREQKRVEKLASRLHKRACKALDVIEAFERGDDTVVDVRIALAAVDTFTDLALKASDRVRTLADRKLHYSGADAPDDAVSDLAGAEARLTSKLARLAAADAASAPEQPLGPGEEGS